MLGRSSWLAVGLIAMGTTFASAGSIRSVNTHGPVSFGADHSSTAKHYWRDTSRSISLYQPFYAGSEGAPYGTTGPASSGFVLNSGSVWTLPDTSDRALPVAAGPKIIDVSSERLDQRGYPNGGLDIVYSGTAKIIRVPPNYRLDEAREPENDRVAKLTPAPNASLSHTDLDEFVDEPPIDEELDLWSEPTNVPVPTPADRPVASAPSQPTIGIDGPAAPAFEPWTEEWLRDCVARYPTFDATLGTYNDETGRRRFCTGETS